MSRPAFVYGTQYYRAPTPLPEEWEGDFRNLRLLGLNTVQLRLQWRQHESRRGVYDFRDSDRLMELAVQNGVQVILKLMLENAPDYVFSELGGTRISLDGRPLRPGAHGAFYIGGWLPCFDNPEVMAAALAFVRETVRRYRGNPALAYWNVWNEPRTKPIGECCCAHSVRCYQESLRKGFGEVERLNGFYGKKWSSFEAVLPPGSALDYAELDLWRRHALTRVTERLRQVRDAVLAEDSLHPAYCHVGCCTVIQDVAGDGSDDIENARLFPFYGTSFPVSDRFESLEERVAPFLIGDWMHHVSPRFWVNELYPEWGDWMPPIRDGDFRYKLFSALACGAKGLLYWQYRAERLGCENDLAGLVHMDGSFKEVSRLCAETGHMVEENAEFLADAVPEHDRIGILYDLRSDMISRIEDTGPGQWDFETADGGAGLYKRNLQGTYALLHEMHLHPHFVDSRRLAEAVQGLDVLFLPEFFLPSEETVGILEEFVRRGGALVADSGYGLRQQNTWLNFPWPGCHGREWFGGQFRRRVSAAQDGRRCREFEIAASGYCAFLEPFPATATPLHWEDGTPAALRKGRCLLVGTALGAAFLEGRAPDAGRFLREMLGEALPRREEPTGVQTRILRNGVRRMAFVFNRMREEAEVRVGGRVVRVPAMDCAVFPIPPSVGGSPSSMDIWAEAAGTLR